MSDNTWPIAIRYTLKEQPSLDLPFEAYWDTHGFALRDSGGDEHHFGLPENVGGHAIYTWIALYSDEGREDWPGDVHDKLTGGKYELADPTLGPKLSGFVEVALEGLAEFAVDKGFAFDPERERAVRAFLTLRRAGEDYDPDEVYVWGATNGFRRPKDAKMLKEYAQRAIDGKGSRTVNGYAIKLDPAQADRVIEYWRQQLAERTSLGTGGTT